MNLQGHLEASRKALFAHFLMYRTFCDGPVGKGPYGCGGQREEKKCKNTRCCSLRGPPQKQFYSSKGGTDFTLRGQKVEASLGLKRKCIFPFSRQCENHAKMGRFSRNFTKFRFAKIFRFRENFRKNLEYFSRKTKNFNFCENLVCFSRKQNSDFRENFRKNLVHFSPKFSRKRKNAGFRENCSKFFLFHQTFLRKQKFLADNLKFS
jgi:hypothetical protein